MITGPSLPAQDRAMVVECVDDSGNQIVVESIEPSRVKVADSTRGATAAKVRLTVEDQRAGARGGGGEDAVHRAGGRSAKRRPATGEGEAPPAENALRQYPVSADAWPCA